jgi:hypothetical protein
MRKQKAVSLNTVTVLFRIAVYTSQADVTRKDRDIKVMVELVGPYRKENC